MKKSTGLSSIVLLLLLYSCECKRYQCPAFPGNAWLPYHNITYRSASSAGELVFQVAQKDLSNSYGEDETVLSFSCKENDCVATASLKAHTAPGTAGRTLELHFTNNYQGKTFSNTRLHYVLDGMEGGFTVNPGLLQSRTEATEDWYADSIRSVNTGLTVYPEVLIQTRKATGNSGAVVKTYWQAEGKLIGFALDNGQVYWIK
jgi:hypothetical protein